MVGAIGGVGVSGGLSNIVAVGGLATTSAVGAAAKTGNESRASAISAAPTPSTTVTISAAAKKALASDLNLSSGVMGLSSAVTATDETNDPNINALGQSVSGLNQMDKVIEALLLALLNELEKKDNAPIVLA